MHEPVANGIEDYLSGRAASDLVLAIEGHLASCAECRGEVVELREHSAMLRLLRAPENMEPAAGFYARVMGRIEAQTANSFWSIFLEPVFARRLLYASLALLVLLTSAVWKTDSEPVLHAGNPVSIMAGNELPAADGVDPRHDREVVLANLASYGAEAPAELPVSSE